MPKRSFERVGHPTTDSGGDGKAKRLFQRVQLADAVDFSSFCRLCATSHDPEEMTPLFEDPVSSISSKLSDVIRIQVTDNDGLPDLICSNCLVNLNFVNEFIEKSVAADGLLRNAIIKARAAFDACPPALVEVEVEDSSDSELIEIKEKPIASDSKLMTVGDKLTEITVKPARGNQPVELPVIELGLPVDATSFVSKPIASQGPNEEDNTGGNSYFQSSDSPLNRSVPRIKKCQSLTVVKLGERCETKRGHITFVNSTTGQTTRLPLECRVLNQSEINRLNTRTESEPAARVAPKNIGARGPIVKNLPELKPNTENANTYAHQAKVPYRPPKVSVCELCGKIFVRPAQLRYHMRIHTGERPYACTLCDKKYMVRPQLNFHMRVKHSNEVLPYVECEICGFRTSSFSSLSAHTRVHTNSRPFTCVICSKGFKQRSHLKGHVLTHTTDKPYICAVCGKGFKCKRQCDVHEKAHVQKPLPPERKFQCHVCGKAYAYKSLLEYHMVGHEGRDREFECSHCAKRFVSRNSVKRHIQGAHLGERQFPCAICGRAFSFKTYLRNHIFRMHGIDSSARTPRK